MATTRFVGRITGYTGSDPAMVLRVSATWRMVGPVARLLTSSIGGESRPFRAKVTHQDFPGLVLTARLDRLTFDGTGASRFSLIVPATFDVNVLQRLLKRNVLIEIEEAETDA